MAHGKVHTWDMVQRRRPGSFLSPKRCILCKKGEESADHVSLHSPCTLSLWLKILEVNARLSFPILSEKHKNFGGEMKAKFYGDTLLLLLFGSFSWKEIREYLKTRLGLVKRMYNRVKFWISLKASVTTEFRIFSFLSYSCGLQGCEHEYI